MNSNVPAPNLPARPVDPASLSADDQKALKIWNTVSWAMNSAGWAAIALKGVVKDLEKKGTLSDSTGKAIDTALDAFYQADAPALGFLNDYITHMQGGDWPVVPIPQPNLPPDPSSTSAFQATLNAIAGAIDTIVTALPDSGDSKALVDALAHVQTAITNVLTVIQTNYPHLFG